METTQDTNNTESRLVNLQDIVALPIFRQVGLLLALAAAVAIGLAMLMWLQKPSYSVLFGGMADQEAAQVAEVLQQRGADYKIDERSGALLVPSQDVHALRLELANMGLPKSSGVGLEVLQQKQEFGTSQFIQTARYQHALEQELARTIMSLSAVQSARVHLAMPKQSVFVRKRKPATASVVLQLYRGRALEQDQVSAISHMVASSIPNMEAESVTVVDHHGRLLSKPERSAEMALNQDQFEYSRKLEETYVTRIEEILAPVIGRNGMSAQVTAEVDFTVTEQTQETYNPDLPALRSEQVTEEQSLGAGAQGIPGALSNQPPALAEAPEVVGAEGGTEQGSPLNTRRRSTSNYELDKTISHSRLSTGILKRLSIAVVVDNRSAVDEEGNTVSQPRSAEEMERLTALVREAVGYSAQRGDTVNVINAAFAGVEAFAVPEVPIWEQPWAVDYAKTAAVGLALVALIFGVVRPLVRNLTAPPVIEGDMVMAQPQAEETPVENYLPQGEVVRLPPPGAYEHNIKLVQKVVQDDPKLVAQVVRNWISDT